MANRTHEAVTNTGLVDRSWQGLALRAMGEDAAGRRFKGLWNLACLPSELVGAPTGRPPFRCHECLA